MRANTSSKIDFLMRVTGMSNAQLAHALSFDPSYISRIRAGKRGLPPELPFIEPAAAFFARNVREKYQAEALAREIGVAGAWPKDRNQAARLIAGWLEGAGVTADGCPMDGPEFVSPGPRAAGRACEARLFFGNEGHRDAALAFLGCIAEAGEPCELLLQSDEGTAWMYEDATFERDWTGLMTRLAKAGCTFTVVHTVSRSGEEMWEGVREWLPLYLSGAVRPYYYPRLRDGVRSRSLFVARGRCALVSNSVTGMGNDGFSVMLEDAGAVSALEREFDAYLKLCSPLVEVERPLSKADFNAAIHDFRGSDDAVAAEVAGAVVCVRTGRDAIVASLGERPTLIRIAEPRLSDAIAGYIGSQSGKVASPTEVGALLDGIAERAAPFWQ